MAPSKRSLGSEFRAALSLEDAKEAVSKADKGAPISAPDGTIALFNSVVELIGDTRREYYDTNLQGITKLQDAIDTWHRNLIYPLLDNNDAESKSIKAWAGTLNAGVGNGMNASITTINYRNMEEAAKKLRKLLQKKPELTEELATMNDIMSKFMPLKEHIERYQTTHEIETMMKEIGTALATVDNKLIPDPPEHALVVLATARHDIKKGIRVMQAADNPTILEDSPDEESNQRLTVTRHMQILDKLFQEHDIEAKADAALEAQRAK